MPGAQPDRHNPGLGSNEMFGRGKSARKTGPGAEERGRYL